MTSTARQRPPAQLFGGWELGLLVLMALIYVGGTFFNPTIFLYDHVPGGVGLAGRLFEQRVELLLRARRLVENCACEDGCPSCIGPSPGAQRPEDGLGPRRSFCLEVLGYLGVQALQ